MKDSPEERRLLAVGSLKVFSNLKAFSDELVKIAGFREAANKTTSEQLKNESFKPVGPVESLESGTTYLDHIDSKWRRHYKTA